MPTYEYACKDCGRHLEIVQSFTEQPLTTCTACGGQLRKVFSAAGIIFKGSGYYVTDSRAKPGAAASGGNSAKAGKQEGSAGSEAAADKGKGSASGSSDSTSSSEPSAKSA